MRFSKPLFLVFCLLVSPLLAFSQDVEMADVMRSNGKIYVVVAVVIVILIGILLFIFQTEKKLNKLEKEIDAIKGEK